MEKRVGLLMEVWGTRASTKNDDGDDGDDGNVDGKVDDDEKISATPRRVLIPRKIMVEWSAEMGLYGLLAGRSGRQWFWNSRSIVCFGPVAKLSTDSFEASDQDRFL